MKKITAILLISLTIFLSACATIAGAATPVETTATPGIVAENYANALPVPSQIALGIIRLKDTPNAVTADEAANLVFLWKGMEALSSTTGSSQIETIALLAQIQDSMKPEQLKAISDMKLVQADIQKALAEFGPAAGAARAAGAGTGGTTTGRNQNPGGGFQGFGGPGGQGVQGGTGNQSIPPSTQATIQARAAQQSNRGNTLLYTAVVRYLETLVPAK